MKKSSLLILVAGVFLLTACKNIECDAFPTKYLGYIPYSVGNTRQFVNENSDTLSFPIKTNSISKPYSYEWNCKCTCLSDANFETETDNRHSLSIEGHIVFYEDGVFDFSCYFNNAERHSDGFNFRQEHSKDLSDTIILENQQCNRVEKVKIIRGKGIVEFSDKKENCMWILLDK